jgi:hypothetical protein
MAKAAAEKEPTKDELLKQKEQELRELQDHVRLLEEKEASQSDMSKYMDDIADIKKQGTVTSNTITYREDTDHKNISLYTMWGKRVGPMHRNNALSTFERFSELAKTKGKPWLRLLPPSRKPSDEDIKKFYESEWGKTYLKELKESRAKKLKLNKTSSVDKLVAAMEKQYGVKVQNTILPQDQVKGASKE